MYQPSYFNNFPKGRLAIVVVALLFTLSSVQQLSAEQVTYQDINGDWITLEASDWPQVDTSAENARVTIGGTRGSGGITFNVVFLDVANNTNIGFDDPVEGAARRAIVFDVLAYVNSLLDEDGSCDIEFLESLNTGTGALASGGPFFFTSSPNFINGFAFEHIKTGIDPTGSVPDIQVQFNFGYNWNSTVGSPAVNEFDLYSTLLHEITHGLGLISFSDSTGAGVGGTNDTYAFWDDFLFTGNGTKLWNSSNGNFQGNASALTGGDGGIEFQGPLTTAENSNTPPPIYAPSPFEPGSSIGHFDDGLGAVMGPFLAPGEETRVYVSFEIQAFADIGYDLPPVPVAGASKWLSYE
jgi:hypothetical protein